MINYGKHHINTKDIKNVSRVLKSNYLTQGPLVEKFESTFKKNFNSTYCTAVSSGSAALHLLSIALGWKKNDIIITTPLSFVATSNCILYSKATPLFIDINYETGNICCEKLEKTIKFLKKKKKKVKAVIAIDYGGCPSDWPRLRSITKKNNIILINDACHALGSSINNDKKYFTKYADFATYSFHPVKSITTGEGGMILSNKKDIDQKLKKLRSHGIEKNKKLYPWHQDMKFLGYNYRITDFQCALGISQLKRINQFINKRKKIASIYKKNLSNIKFTYLQKIPKSFSSSYHLFILKINFKKLRISKKIFFNKLAKLGINLQVHYIPIYRHSYYRKKFKIKFSEFPNTEKFYSEVVSLPIFYDLKFKTQKYIVKSLKKII